MILSRVLYTTGLLLIAIGLLPFFSMLLSELIGVLLGCSIDESSASSCYFLGKNVGSMLYDMYIFGWAMGLTLPIALLGFIVIALTFIYSMTKKLFKLYKRMVARKE
ncbi:MAG: hypothetical protein ACLFOC_09610 [Campylobacterales bacterium]